MPRTKAAKKKAPASQIKEHHLADLRAAIEDVFEKKSELVKKSYEEFANKVDVSFEMFLMVTKHYSHMTHAELLQKNASGMSSINSSSASRKRRRSKSCTSVDDGYITADSNASKRTSRSATRARNTQTVTNTLKVPTSKNTTDKDAFKTPLNCQVPLMSYITPKIQPNATIKVLREPNKEEIGFSTEGSPLLVSKYTPNVHIPGIDGGKMFSIQAKKGLRHSQIPEMDDVIKTHLTTLRDNLDKICLNYRK